MSTRDKLKIAAYAILCLLCCIGTCYIVVTCISELREVGLKGIGEEIWYGSDGER